MNGIDLRKPAISSRSQHVEHLATNHAVRPRSLGKKQSLVAHKLSIWLHREQLKGQRLQGIAGKDGGQIGAGLVRAHPGCFEAAAAAYRDRYGA